jgi:hypothetical protein
MTTAEKSDHSYPNVITPFDIKNAWALDSLLGVRGHEYIEELLEAEEATRTKWYLEKGGRELKESREK